MINGMQHGVFEAQASIQASLEFIPPIPVIRSNCFSHQTTHFSHRASCWEGLQSVT